MMRATRVRLTGNPWRRNQRCTRGAQQFGPDGETDLEVLHMDEEGDLAYWVGLQHATVSVNGHTNEMHLRITELFRREDGSWKLVHRHADPHASPSP
jgi:ketosteroid isomerase-like protein